MDEENENVYSIPANYTDSGKIFGGMLALRNAIETILLIAAVGILEYFMIPVAGVIRVIVMAVTLIPLAILGMMGINGDSLFTFVFHMVTFLFRRKKLIYGEVEYGEKEKE